MSPFENFTRLKRNPTDVELVMFAQSGHRGTVAQEVFADWVINGKRQPHSLFGMIRQTHAEPQRHARRLAIMPPGDRRRALGAFLPAAGDAPCGCEEQVHLVKVGTQCHGDFAVPGAATGSGGEIRERGARTRRQAQRPASPVSRCPNLRLPDAPRPWEPYGQRDRIASALSIMLEGPIGAGLQ